MLGLKIIVHSLHHHREKSLDDLAKFLPEDRKKRIEDVLCNRTRAISILLEDIYQGHNISAVLRTCDNLGIQDVHIFQDVNKTPLSKGISLGSEKWISLHIKDSPIHGQGLFAKTDINSDTEPVSYTHLTLPTSDLV